MHASYICLDLRHSEWHRSKILFSIERAGFSFSLDLVSDSDESQSWCVMIRARRNKVSLSWAALTFALDVRWPRDDFSWTPVDRDPVSKTLADAIRFRWVIAIGVF